ncbi:hypothetical protein ACROYT_G017560 [Oculina patagonica]
MGPGTKLAKRLKRGDPGINRLDKIAKQHDIDYSHAKNLRDKWKADEKMIKAINKLPGIAAGYALLFPRKGTSDYVIIRGMPSLTAVTVCLWMKTADTGNEGTPLGYNVGSTNELLLHDYRNFWFWIGGTQSGKTSVSANDGNWHHICATWENTAGSRKMYKDGKVAFSATGVKTGYVIRGGGALVLGQEQDSEGGTFDAKQSFIGEMTGVNIWDHVIKDQEITRMSKSCLAGVGNVFQWSDFKAHLKGSVKIIKPSFAADYALLFPRKGTTDYVITSGMPSLTAVTVCLWMKTADTGNEGIPLSYAVSTVDSNELTLWDYRNLQAVLLYLQTMESGITSAQHGRIPLDHGTCSKMARLRLLVKVIKQATWFVAVEPWY